MTKIITPLFFGLLVFPTFAQDQDAVDSDLKHLMRLAIIHPDFRKELKLTRNQTDKYKELNRVGREEMSRKFDILSNPDSEDYLRRKEKHKKFLKETGIEKAFKELFKDELKSMESKSGDVPGLMDTFRYQSPEYKAAVKARQEEQKSLDSDLWNTFNKKQKARLLRMARYLKIRNDGVVDVLKRNNDLLGENKLDSAQLKRIVRANKLTEKEWKKSFELEALKLKEKVFREALESGKVGFLPSSKQKIREASSEKDPDAVLSFVQAYKGTWGYWEARRYQSLRSVDSDLRREVLAKAIFEKRMRHLWSLLEAIGVRLSKGQEDALVEFYGPEDSSDYWSEWLAIDIERLHKFAKYDGRAKNLRLKEANEPIAPKEF